MTKPLDVAPALPTGCVDFNLLHEAVKKGDTDAVAKALVVPAGETAKAHAALLEQAEKSDEKGDAAADAKPAASSRGA